MTSKSGLLLLRFGLYCAVAFLLWIMLRGPKTVKAIVVRSLFTVASLVVSYYCFRAVTSRAQTKTPSAGCVVLARARSSTLFYLGVAGVWLSLILTAFSLVGQISEGTGSQSQLLLGYGMGSFALGFLYAWLGCYQLRISPGLLEYWSLFGGYRSIPADRIQKGRIRIGESSYRDRYRPTIRLEILPIRHHGPKSKPILVNLKVFRKEDMDRVFDWLGPKLEEPDHRNSGSGSMSTGMKSPGLHG